jgi:DNA-binding response OmpR family regulator
MKILIIDDDPKVSDFLKNNLINDNFLVEVSNKGADGSYKARINHYDLIIIDYALPDKNGITVCSEIRAAGSDAIILFLSATLDFKNKVKCLEAGADDYVTKPFAFEELRARIKALIRRSKKTENNIVTVSNLTLDIKKQTVRRDKLFIHLTKTEYNLLEYLMINKGTVLSRGMIMEHVWSANSDPFSNTIEAHMTNLRKKLGIKTTADIIRNIAGRGYIIDS